MSLPTFNFIGPSFVFDGLSGLSLIVSFFMRWEFVVLIRINLGAPPLLIRLDGLPEEIGSKRWWLRNWLHGVGGGDLGRPSGHISEPHRGARERDSATDYGSGVTVNFLMPDPSQSTWDWVAPCPALDDRQVRAQTWGGARILVAGEPGSHLRCHCCASRSDVRCVGGVLSDSKDLFRSLMGCGVLKHLWNHCLFLDFSLGLILVLFGVA